MSEPKRPLPEGDDSDDEPVGKKLKEEAPVEVKEVRVQTFRD